MVSAVLIPVDGDLCLARALAHGRPGLYCCLNCYTYNLPFLHLSESLSENGRRLFHSESALICNSCVESLNSASSTSSSPSTVSSPNDTPSAASSTASTASYTASTSSTTASAADSSDEDSVIHITQETKRKAAPLVFKPKPPPKKRRDSTLYKHFTIIDLESGGVSVTCNHCHKFNKRGLQKFNPSHGRGHLVNQCKGVGKETKRQLLKGSQANKRNGSLFAYSSEGTVDEMRGSALSSSSRCQATMSPLTANSVPPVPHFGVPSLPPIDLTGIESNPKRKKQQPIGFPTLNRAEAEKIIKRKVRTTLARGETLNRLVDDHMVAEMVADFPAIAFYLPKDEATVFSKYAVPIDIESQEELKNFMLKLPGLINMSMDGATCNGKQKVSK